jgi:hypothetical protein
MRIGYLGVVFGLLAQALRFHFDAVHHKNLRYSPKTCALCQELFACLWLIPDIRAPSSIPLEELRVKTKCGEGLRRRSSN